MKQVLGWVGSVFFGLLTLTCLVNLPESWGGLFLSIPMLLLNPKFSTWLARKNVRYKKLPVNLAAVLIPLVIFGATAPPTVQQSVNSTSLSSAILSSFSSEASSKTTQQSANSTISTISESSGSTVSSKTTSADALSSDNIVRTTATVPAPEVHAGATLKVHYIDVGQGDSEFLELPNGQTMLIDAGNPENGSQIVNYIKGLDHNKIDYLIATHPHADHIGGMATVVNELGIGKIYMPKVSTNTKTYENLLSAIQDKELKVNTAKAGVNLFKVGNLNADIIAPVNITGDDLNQYSAVVLLTYGDNKFLFMGDAGEPSEKQITEDIKADVLKVGHHGSNTATSQAFLNKVHPKYAVIEVGKDNSYGHPTAATLSKLQNIGATIYRTDNDGTIIFTSDAKTITVNKKASSVKEQAPPPPASSKAAGSKLTSSNTNTTLASSTDNQSVTVYITKTGKKYHRAGCRYLSRSKIAISLKDAKAAGYEPCSVCNPPQ